MDTERLVANAAALQQRQQQQHRTGGRSNGGGNLDGEFCMLELVEEFLPLLLCLGGHLPSLPAIRSHHLASSLVQSASCCCAAERDILRRQPEIVGKPPDALQRIQQRLAG